MSKKLFFDSIEGEMCHDKSHFYDIMKDDGLTEMKVFTAKIETDTEYFWCTEYQEVGIKGEGCGSDCESYSPRNGKNGRCKFSGNCYTPTNEIILKLPKTKKP